MAEIEVEVRHEELLQLKGDLRWPLPSLIFIMMKRIIRDRITC